MASRVPSSVSAAMAALRFPQSAAPSPGWSDALEFCDRAQLTLVLGSVVGDCPRIARNLAGNTARLETIRALQSQVAAWLDAAGIDFLFLKGTTQWPHFVSDPRLRMQYDLDLFCPAADARRAWDLIVARGYEPIEQPDDQPTDHLPALIRRTGWQWRGDHFDPQLPLAIEVHFQFWDERTERLQAPGIEEFWPRREGRALALPDALGYNALHLLRHLLRGSLSPYHVYELAWFLEHHAADTEFWDRWQALHAPALRRLEAIAFQLSREWFGCALGPVAEREVALLPAPVHDWFAVFAASPLEGLFHPNKDELWLHFALLTTMRDKLAVARRRLLPAHLPGPVDDTMLVPKEQITAAMQLRGFLVNTRFMAGRALHHVRALVPLISRGARWQMRSGGLSEGYWLFLGASLLMDLGMFIFVLLFNLYLIDLGFREDFVGQVASAATAGMVAGTLPAAALARRLGLGKILFASFAAVALLAACEALLTARAPLLVFSFLGGVAMSAYAVSLAPAIARLTSERARATGFSISTASSIALGIPAYWIGGQLPGWMGGKRPAMLAGCALVLLALFPAARLRIGPAPAEGARLYPRSRFVIQFLAVFAIWNLATGSFDPFFNTYFARLHTPVDRIGPIASASQVAQVLALMLAPLVLRRLGVVSGTAAMLLATSLALAALAAGPVGWAAATLYCTYMAFQYMTDPGINTLLMGRVSEPERGGAAALMMLVSFAAQFVASLAGGAGIARFGYPAVLASGAALAAVAALAFRLLPPAPLRTDPGGQALDEEPTHESVS